MSDRSQRPSSGGPPQWALIMMGVLVGLLIVTVMFGLLQKTLDTTALALALVTAISALLTGLIARYIRDGNNGGGS